MAGCTPNGFERSQAGKEQGTNRGPWKMREAEGEKLEHDFTLIEKKCRGRKGIPELNAGRLNGAGSGQLTMTDDCPRSCGCWHPGPPAVVPSPPLGMEESQQDTAFILHRTGSQRLAPRISSLLSQERPARKGCQRSLFL